MAQFTANIPVDMTGPDYIDPGFDHYVSANSSQIVVQYDNQHYGVFDGNFTYDGQGQLTGGTVTGYREIMPDGLQTHLTITGLSVDALTVQQALQNDQILALNQLIFQGVDSFVGSSGADHLTAFDGNDVLRGGVGADTLDGGIGSDTASYSGSAAVNVSLFSHFGTGGDAAGDSLIGIENLIGSDFGDTLTGDALNNNLNGGAGTAADSLAGGAGSDVLHGGAGADTLDGSLGNDGADYTGSAAVNVSLGTHIGVGGDAAGDSLIGIENVIGSSFADTLVGDTNLNVLNGGAGTAADSLSGGAGSDTLVGGGGSDTLDGGIGTDAAYYGGSTAVNVSLVTHTGTSGDAVGDSLIGIENLVGSNFGDTLAGDTGVNSLDGGLGADSLSADAGNDNLRGGGGADTIDGGTGINAADYSGSAAVNVSLVTHTGTGGDAAGDSLIGIGNLIGSGFGDTLTGDGANNVFNGGAGADSLSGAAGNDLLNGGAGADTLDGGGGVDTAYYGTSLAVNVSLATQTGTGGEATGDSLVGVENLVGSCYGDTLTGDAANNNLSGSFGADSLVGGSANDTLIGGAGNDILRGGDGNDHFVFAPGGGEDQVNDFHHASAAGQEQDKLDLTAFHFASAAEALSHASSGGGNTYFDLDGNAATHEITLLGVASVDASDILV